MKMIYDGHEYSYEEDAIRRGTLRNNYGTMVAIGFMCPATSEYYYADEVTEGENGDAAALLGDGIGLIHTNCLIDTPEARGQWLLGCYVAHTS